MNNKLYIIIHFEFFIRRRYASPDENIVNYGCGCNWRTNLWYILPLLKTGILNYE